MIENISLNGQIFKKGDVIKFNDANESRIYLISFSPKAQQAYGIKLTRDCRVDSRCKIGDQGWNIAVTYDQLTKSKILLRDLSLKDIGIDEYIKSEKKGDVVSRMVTPDEIKKHGIKTILDQAEWFIDTKQPMIPSVSLNRQGISFNASAMELMQLKGGEPLEIGLANGRLVFKKGCRGLTLRKTKERKGLMIINKKLVGWLQTKRVKFQRYTVELDQLAGVWTSKFETLEAEKITN